VAQVKVMPRNLLAKHFKLAEKTETHGYALVAAKSGLRMKESAPLAAPAEGGAPPLPPGPHLTD
jgi:uncharacterized protein (TIGR03435 family)